jgi:fatty acid desaturase
MNTRRRLVIAIGGGTLAAPLGPFSDRSSTLFVGTLSHIGDHMRRSTQMHGDRLLHLLASELDAAGCFRMATARSIAYGFFSLSFYSAAYAYLLTAPELFGRILALLTLSFFTVHLGLLGHEAAHGALTPDKCVAARVGQIFMTLLTALSYSYFRYFHREHHANCNDRSLDPDIQSGIFSMYRQSAYTKTGFGKFVSRRQAWLIWVLVWLQGFTLKIDSIAHLRSNPRKTRADQIMLVLHVLLWFTPQILVLGAADALVNYAIMTFPIGPYLSMIFILNHLGNPISEPGETQSHFLHELRVTRNLDSSLMYDYLFGGINNHIEHHLFPAMPTARLRTARRITREFCRRHGVGYMEMPWLAAAREVTRHFKAMSAYVPK